MEETKLKSFIEKLSLKQLDDDERKNDVFSASSLSRKEELFLLNELQNRINIRRAILSKTTPEQEEIIRLFRPRSDTTIQDYILRKRED